MVLLQSIDKSNSNEIIHDFDTSCIPGYLGTRQIIYYLYQSKIAEKIINVEEDTLYQKDDIDLVVTLNPATDMGLFLINHFGKRTITVEIKSDTQDNSGNIFSETVSDCKYNTIGCMLKTKADIVFYFFINTLELYMLYTPNIQTLTIQLKKVFDEREQYHRQRFEFYNSPSHYNEKERNYYYKRIHRYDGFEAYDEKTNSTYRYGNVLLSNSKPNTTELKKTKGILIPRKYIESRTKTCLSKMDIASFLSPCFSTVPRIYQGGKLSDAKDEKRTFDLAGSFYEQLMQEIQLLPFPAQELKQNFALPNKNS